MAQQTFIYGGESDGDMDVDASMDLAVLDKSFNDLTSVTIAYNGTNSGDRPPALISDNFRYIVY